MSNTTAAKNSVKASLTKLTKSYNFSLIIALAVICIVATISSPYFLTVNNIMNIGLTASVSGTMAAGLTIYMLMGALELSQYSIAALSATCIGIFNVNLGIPAVPAILMGLLVAVLCGCINATLLTFGKIPPIIVTLGTMNIFRGIAYALTNARNIVLSDPVFRTIGQQRLFGIIPIPFLVMVVVFLICGFLLSKTKFGRQVYATGANPRAAYLAGIPVQRIRFISMIMASLGAGIAGLLSASQVMTAMPALGNGSEVEITTAVLVGGLSLGGGRGKISGVFLGLFILMTINNALTLHSIPSFYQQMVRGAVLLLAVMIDTFRGGGFNDRV